MSRAKTREVLGLARTHRWGKPHPTTSGLLSSVFRRRIFLRRLVSLGGTMV
jgi:hypothetical protein